jgi:pimeloyl-ACP methyl ester carboxylesterase
MRIGATFAALQAAIDPLDALVLWDPCFSGRSFLREQLALGLLIREKDTIDLPEDEPSTFEGGGMFHIPGFTLSPELLEEMSHLDLAETEGVLAKKVLLLTRSERASDRNSVARQRLVNAEHLEVSGQSELLDVQAPTQVIPAQAIVTIADWLDQVMSRSGGSIAVPVETGVSVRISQAEAVALGSRVDIRLVERGVLLGPAGLFGITTEPEEGGSGPYCIFMSVSNEHRIGPGRLWVELCRRLAANGFRCIRVDVNGFGNSPARDGKLRQPIYLASAMDDVLDTARSISPADPSEVVLFGLCSSAYHVLEGASILSARGVCAINPPVRFQPPEMATGGIVDARRRFCVPQRQLVDNYKRQVVIRWFRRRFPKLDRRARRFTWKVRRLTWGSRGRMRTIGWRARSLLGHAVNQPGDRLDELVESGTDVFLIGGPEELRPFLHSGVSAIRRAQRTGRLRMDEIPSLDHALRRSRDRDIVVRLIVEHVLSHFRATEKARDSCASDPESGQEHGG